MAGGVAALLSGRLASWPVATLLVLWPAFGGHCVEVGFLNHVRPRLPDARLMQVLARVAAWFVGGVGLAPGMRLTAVVLVANTLSSDRCSAIARTIEGSSVRSI